MDASVAEPATAGAGEGPHLELDGFAGPLASLLSLAREHAIDLAGFPLADCIRQLIACAGTDRSGAATHPKGRLAGHGRLAGPAALPPAPAGCQPSGGGGGRRRRIGGPTAWRASAGGTGARRLARPAATTGHRRVRARPAGAGRDRNRPPSRGRRHRVPLGLPEPVRDDDADRIDTTAAYRPARLALCTVPDARQRILQLLAEAANEAPLERFLPALGPSAETALPMPLSLRRRSAVASTLLAGLELAREGVVTLHQPAPFATITLCACPDIACHQLGEAAA